MAKGKLYRGRGTRASQRRAFKARYGKRSGYVYGAVIGKVAREQAIRAGRKTERVRGHPSRTRYGAPEWVRAHEATLRGRDWREGGTYKEHVKGGWVPGHWSRSRTGKREWVRGHRMRGHMTRVARVRRR